MAALRCVNAEALQGLLEDATIGLSEAFYVGDQDHLEIAQNPKRADSAMLYPLRAVGDDAELCPSAPQFRSGAPRVADGSITEEGCGAPRGAPFIFGASRRTVATS